MLRDILKQTERQMPQESRIADDTDASSNESPNSSSGAENEFDQNPRLGWFLIITAGIVIICITIFVLSLY